MIAHFYLLENRLPLVKVEKYRMLYVPINICCMELKDLLPLILIGGSALVGLYKSKKKAASSDTVNDENSSPMKSIFETFFEPDTYVKPVSADEDAYGESYGNESDNEWWKETDGGVQPVKVEEAVVEPVVLSPRKERIISAPLEKVRGYRNRSDRPDFKKKSDIRKGLIFSIVFERPSY